MNRTITVAIAALLLAGCGAAETASETVEPTPATSGAPALTEEEQAAADLDELEASLEAMESELAEVEELAEEPASDLTVAEQNAVGSALSYLDYAGFSRAGLIKQLKFEGYSTADAEAAIDYIDPDWMSEVEESAESYMEYSSFSRSGLIDQLRFEGFTEKQAAHGADSVGL